MAIQVGRAWGVGTSSTVEVTGTWSSTTSGEAGVSRRLAPYTMRGSSYHSTLVELISYALT